MSDTPRTDAQPIIAGNKFAGVPIEHARQLERELTEALRSAREWERIAIQAANDAQALRRRIHDAAVSHIAKLLTTL
jgi:hypothetical protein